MDRNCLDLIDLGVTYAIVPARAGSKGVPNKNVRCIQGYPLMAYSIAVGILCSGVDRVIVSTDSPGYAAVAQHYGGEVPFLRPPEISGDNATDMEFMRHAIHWLAENEGKLPKFFMHLRPTYPFRRIDIVVDALETIKNDICGVGGN